ncbi:MAG: Ig-like domain-containing protein [Treponemataceae bacterium]|nr:Ig-like domain-containing protein [Treponemataceae bacterium]
MMKKLSRIALLAAASAFMLAVFPACGDDEDDPSVEITGEKTVKMGETLGLTASVSDFPDGEVAYAWSSSDEAVATVAADSDDPSKATVTPVAEGTATITVTATAGDTTATTAIEVSVKAEGSVEEEGKEDGTKGVDAVWDFNAESLQAVGLSTTTTKNPKTDPITPKSGSGATLKFTSTSLGKSVKIQNETTGGLNIGSGSNESDMLLITVDEACTLSFTGKGSSGSDWTSSKVNSFSINSKTIYARQSADNASSQTWTYICIAAGEYKIKASGMIFTELKCE